MPFYLAKYLAPALYPISYRSCYNEINPLKNTHISSIASGGVYRAGGFWASTNMRHPDMDVATWALALIANLLGETKIPAWIVALIMSQLKRVLTEDNIKAVENEICCYAFKHVNEIAAKTNCPDLAAAIKLIETQVGCTCAPENAPATAAAAA